MALFHRHRLTGSGLEEAFDEGSVSAINGAETINRIDGQFPIWMGRRIYFV